MNPSTLPIILFLLSGASANLLESYQQLIVNYTTTIDDQLSVLRSINGAHGLQLTHQALREFANFTLEMRAKADTAWRFVKDSVKASDYCMDYIQAVYAASVGKGETDMKSCAARWTRLVSEDASERFWPLISEAQLWNSQGVARVVGVLAQLEQVLERDEVEEELKVTLADIEDGWTRRKEQLDDEIGQHEMFADTVLGALQDCAEEAIIWHHNYMNFVMDLVVIC